MLSGVPDCSPSGNPVLQVHSLTSELFIELITGDIYKYDYDNKLFIFLDEIDHDMAEELSSILNDQDQRWLKVAAPCWS